MYFLASERAPAGPETGLNGCEGLLNHLQTKGNTAVPGYSQQAWFCWSFLCALGRLFKQNTNQSHRITPWILMWIQLERSLGTHFDWNRWWKRSFTQHSEEEAKHSDKETQRNNPYKKSGLFPNISIYAKSYSFTRKRHEPKYYITLVWI